MNSAPTLLFTIILQFFFLNVLFADTIPSKTPLRYNLLGNYFVPCQVNNEFGATQINPTGSMSWAFGIDFLPIVSRNFYGIFGANVIRIPTERFIISIPKENLTDNPPNDINELFYPSGNISLSVPLGMGVNSLNPRFPIFFEGSVCFFLYPKHLSENYLDYYEDSGQSSRLFYSRSESTENPIKFNIQLSTGWSFDSKYGQIQTKILWNHSFQNLLEGTYTFYNTNGGTTSSGRISLSGSYLAVGLSLALNQHESISTKNRNNTSNDKSKTKSERYLPIGFNLSLNHCSAGTVEQEYGDLSYEPQQGVGFSFGLEYYPINRGYNALYTGLSLSFLPLYSGEAIISAEDSEDGISKRIEPKHLAPSISIPLAYERRFMDSEKLMLFISAGIEFSLYVLQQDYRTGAFIGEVPDPLNPTIEDFNFYLDVDINKRLIPNTIFSVGTYLKSEASTWKISMNLFIPFEDHARGYYEFKDLQVSDDSKGSYAFRGNFIGVSVAYFPWKFLTQKR